MVDRTSESLLVRLRSPDDAEAWAKFAEIYSPLIFYWARKNGLGAHDAADLAQEVMTLVFQKLPEFQYDSRRSFRGWLRTVTLNKHRARMRKKSLSMEDVGQTGLVSLPENVQLAMQSWDQDYSKQLVSQTIELMRREFAPLFESPRMHDVRKRLLEDALGFYEDLARDESRNVNMQPHRASVLQQMGNIHSSLGQHPKAEAALLEAEIALG